jgi:hypothetical protein
MNNKTDNKTIQQLREAIQTLENWMNGNGHLPTRNDLNVLRYAAKRDLDQRKKETNG